MKMRHKRKIQALVACKRRNQSKSDELPVEMLSQMVFSNTYPRAEKVARLMLGTRIIGQLRSAMRSVAAQIVKTMRGADGTA